MNTQQQGTEVPHICTALEHCHQLNERVADLEGLVRAIGQSASEDGNALRELTNKMQGDAAQWHNALAAESRKHAAAIDALETALARIESWDAATAPDCGGCAGKGSHKRWCPEVVGEKAARLGRWAEEAESLGDRIGANDKLAANHIYQTAARLTTMAGDAAAKHIAAKQDLL